jgi:hypothetical protein
VCVFIFFLERIVETCKLNSGDKSSLTNYFERDLCCVLCIWVGGEMESGRITGMEVSVGVCVWWARERETRLVYIPTTSFPTERSCGMVPRFS